MSTNNPNLVAEGPKNDVSSSTCKSLREPQHSASTALDLAPRTAQESTKSAFTSPPVQSSATSRPLIQTTSSMSQPVITKTGHVTAPVMPVSQLHGTTVTSASFAPMASIIRGTSHGMHKPPTSHMPHSVVQATYSSHVPRGVGTVACITTLKSSVATPMQRPSHLIQQAGASNVSALPLFMQMQSKPAGKNTLNPPVSKPTPPTLASSAPMEPSRFVTNVTTAPSVMITGPRLSDSMMRPALVHATPMMPKPQPFSQHIQQLSEKSLYKASTAQSTASAPQPANPVLHAISSVPQNTSSQSSTTLHLSQVPSSAANHPGLRMTATNLQAASSATGSKAMTPTVHAVMPITQMPQQQPALISAAVTTARAVAVSTTSTGLLNTQRLVTSTQSTTQIPVAKVYPQPLPVAPRLPGENIAPPQDAVPSTTAGVFVTPTPRGQTTNSNITAATGLTSVQNLPPTVILTETRQDRSSMVSSSPYALPPVTTYYYEPFPNALTMHPYPGNATPHAFGVVPGTTFRTVSAHQTGNLSSGGQAGRAAAIAVTTSGTMHMNSMMVTVNPARNHVGLQTTYSTATEASTTSSAPLMVTAVSPSHPTHNIQIAQNSPSNPSVSPRPSILRKRTADTSGIRKQLLPSLCGSQPPSPHESTSSILATAISTITSSQSPKPQSDATRECSTPSESNDSNSNNGAQLLVIKKEPLDPSEVGNTVNPLSTEASPRKKPRKQQLMGKELVETHTVDAADEFQKSVVKKEVVREDFVDEDGVRWVSSKLRPPISLINSYRHTWKSRNNHFMRYSDIKPKEDRRPTVNDFANQRGILQKANGWKVWHLCTQIDEMVELENSAHTTLSVILESMEKKIGAKENEDKELNRANELIRGNLQRSKIIHDQMKDARLQILKVLDHKSNIVDIVGKYVSKRSIRKKEKL